MSSTHPPQPLSHAKCGAQNLVSSPLMMRLCAAFAGFGPGSSPPERELVPSGVAGPNSPSAGNRLAGVSHSACSVLPWQKPPVFRPPPQLLRSEQQAELKLTLAQLKPGLLDKSYRVDGATDPGSRRGHPSARSS